MKPTTNRAVSEKSSPYAKLKGIEQVQGLAWSDVNPGLVLEFIYTVSANGHAPLLGTTRQGGLSVTIYSDGAPIKFYSSDAVDMGEKLREATAIAANLLPPEVRRFITQKVGDLGIG